MESRGCQFLVVGGGITGLTIARELLRRGADDVIVLEKEQTLGVHASGRNSGVLHAGIYYTPETYKARFCVRGNRMMKEFCREKGLALKETGKVIVAKGPEQVEGLHELKRRADAAGARAELIDQRQLEEHEPHAVTHEVALWSPDTAVIRPTQILEALASELTATGKVRILSGTKLLRPRGGSSVDTTTGTIAYEKLVNAAGSFADRIARLWGLGLQYRTLPFKGTYKKLNKSAAHLVRGNVYPVPDLGTPFLGVHLTKNIEGDVYVGPTAIPAFGRENYRGFGGWGWETAPIVWREALLFMRDRSFRSAAFLESRKYFRRYMFGEARKMVPDLKATDFLRTDKVGLRPQLVHWETKKLEMDFVLIRTENALHVLNAISPAFTSSMSFAEYAVSELLGGGGAAPGDALKKGDNDAFRVQETRDS